jgi:hypothetical protein
MNSPTLYAAALFACLAACRDGAPRAGSTSSGGSTDAPNAAAIVDDAQASPTTVVASEDAGASRSIADGATQASGDGSVQTQNSRLEQRVRAMAANPALIAASVRAPRGLSLIRYTEAPPSGRGREVHSSEHLCGAAVGRRERELHAIFALAVRRADEGQGIECDATSCTVSGMEHEDTRIFRFNPSETSDPPQLEAIELVTTAAMGEEWMTRMETFARNAFAQHAAHPCAAR